MNTPHTDLWFVPIEARPAARVRLICFPFAGSSAQVYDSWRFDNPDIEVRAAELPGHGARGLETPISQAMALVSALTEALLPLADRQLVLFGHSLGAFLAFGIARRLRVLGAKGPALLIVAGQRAPQLPDREAPLSHLDDRTFIDALRDYGGTPSELLENRDFMRRVLPALRADFMAAESFRYRPGEPLDCAIIALGGREDTTVSEEELPAWREQTRAGFELRMFSGGHFFVETARNEVLAVIAGRVGQLAGQPISAAPAPSGAVK